MIARKIPMRVAKKSNVSELVAYMVDPQGTRERVGLVTVTNCHQDEALDAALEMKAMQARNTRAKSDKTYHLLIAFPTGESPSAEVLREIEARICGDLGYQDHQRVSAVHYDTDNVHIHVAINKIHPTRNTLHEPYNDHKTLGKSCERLEVEYGLERTNHTPRRTASQGRAADMEQHAGVESLISWAQRECAPELRAAKTWAEVHGLMQSHGLRLRTQGNGLVLEDSSGLTVKASSIAREFSKAQMERRLGQFEAPKAPAVPAVPDAARTTTDGKAGQQPQPEQRGGVEARPWSPPPLPRVGTAPPPPLRGRLAPMSALRSLPMQRRPTYGKRPLHTADTSYLYARYQQERAAGADHRAEQWKLLRESRVRQVEDAKKRAKAKRAAIKLVGRGIEKRVLYALVSKQLRKDLEQIQGQYAEKRKALLKGSGGLAWADWLKARAQEGSHEALSALRAREARKSFRGNLLRGQSIVRPGAVPGLQRDGITKVGTVIYRFGQTAVRDDGALLNVSRDAGQRGLEAALRMAMHRYGKSIEVNGSEQFKARIVAVAVATKLEVEFDDPALEARRRELLKEATSKESTYEHGKRNAGRRERNGQRAGRDGGQRDDYAAAAAVSRRGSGATAERHGHAGREQRGGASVRQPHAIGVGRNPPPQSRNRLHALSQLGVVRLSAGSEVLLPGDVPHHVEHQRTQRDDAVRRPAARGVESQVVAPPDRAARLYIEEREQKRAAGFDIKKHRRYNDRDSGEVAFVGVRTIESQNLALLSRGDEILVLPVDAATVRRLKRLTLGEPVTANERGAIKTKGRSR